MKDRNVLEILGKNLHDIRFKKNISIRELAVRVNIDIKTLMEFEAGEPSAIKIPQYTLIANALGVDCKNITKGIEFTEN